MSAVAAPSLASAAVARSLAVALAPPSEEGLAHLERLVTALGREPLARPVEEGVAALAAALAGGTPLDVLEVEYETLFGTEGACPPYEGSFERDPFRETRSMADVAGFYLAFGAEPDGPNIDRPDHLGCELEFLAFLGARRIDAAESGDPDFAETCRVAEDAFLEEHVGRVLPALCDEVAGIAVVPLYLAVAGLGSAWMKDELTRRGLEARPAGQRRRRGEMESDQLACGEACGLPAEQVLQKLQPRLKAPKGDGG